MLRNVLSRIERVGKMPNVYFDRDEDSDVFTLSMIWVFRGLGTISLEAHENGKWSYWFYVFNTPWSIHSIENANRVPSIFWDRLREMRDWVPCDV